jgi:DNA-binding CsgD family transcriptional regulator
MAARNSTSGTALRLSSRERQCLELAALGKSDWAISQLLDISEHTVHKHIEAAKRRLGVATRVQAIVWAAQRREISLADILSAGEPNKRATSRPAPKARTTAASKARSSLRGSRPLC